MPRTSLVIAVAAGLFCSGHALLGQQRSQAVRSGRTSLDRPPYVQASLSSTEEERFVKRLANDLAQAVVDGAAAPDAPLPPGTAAARILAAYRQFDPSRLARISEASRKVRRTATAIQPGTGARSAGREAAAFRSAQSPGLDPAMRRELRTLIHRRLDRMPSGLGDITRLVSREFRRIPRTWVLGGVFGEADAGGKREITLNEPQALGFRWGSDEPGAARGYWELRQQSTRLVGEKVLATGITAGQATRTGIKGFFEIDLAKYLPPRPIVGAPDYHVRVKPLGKQGSAPARTRGRTITPAPKPSATGPSGGSEPDGVGPWSEPVVIHYGIPTTPPQTFEEVYRKTRFHLDTIYMVEDQQGPGAEEFWLAGFVQPHSPGGTGNQHKFGPDFAKLDPDGPRQERFDEQTTFDIPSGSTDWPRMYTVVISILEEDDGGAFRDWLDAVWAIADGLLSEEIDAAIKDQLSRLREELATDAAEEAFDLAIEVIKASTTADFVSAFVKNLVAGIAAAIEGGLPDDYYGTEAITFFLLNNRVDFVQDAFAFVIMHGRSAEELTGQRQTNGEFRVKPKVIRFYGQAAYPEAGGFNGIVDITMHWVLADRGL